MDCARTVAVVVPSPATSEVLEATSLTSCAPMFSNLSSSSISLATVTPSLVMSGEPKDLSMTTLRPLGPRVTLTAAARVLTPFRMALRPSWSNLISFAAMLFLPPLSCARMCGMIDRFRQPGPDRQAVRTGRGRSPRPLRPEQPLLFQDAEDVVLAHDQEVVAVELDLGAG